MKGVKSLTCEDIGSRWMCYSQNDSESLLVERVEIKNELFQNDWERTELRTVDEKGLAHFTFDELAECKHEGKKLKCSASGEEEQVWIM